MKILAITLVCGAIVLVFGYQFFSGSQGEKKVNERWETATKRFKVSVTAYAEDNGGFAAGAYYVFRSATPGSDDWKEIMTFRHDDPVTIPREQIRFVNDEVGYVFMGWMYAVTTDGGSNWSVWSAEKDLPGWQCCNYKLIQDVRIAPDGVGTMKLNPIPQREGEVPELRTKDYGRHWGWNDLSQPNATTTARPGFAYANRRTLHHPRQRSCRHPSPGRSDNWYVSRDFGTTYDQVAG